MTRLPVNILILSRLLMFEVCVHCTGFPHLLLVYLCGSVTAPHTGRLDVLLVSVDLCVCRRFLQ